jgi:hypothetical protein
MNSARKVVLMVDLSRSFKPLALPRPQGAHRYDVFSPKLGRRLTQYRRSAFEVWLMIESDPAVQTLCDRPGLITVDGQRFVVDFWARYGDRECVVLPSQSAPAIERLRNIPDFDLEAITVRSIEIGRQRSELMEDT